MPGRASAQEITLFESQGIGLEDLAMARLLVDRARARGVGNSTRAAVRNGDTVLVTGSSGGVGAAVVQLAQLRGATPKYGALWATYFPGLTLEWYPNVLVVSNLIPRSPEITTNVVEFYYPEEIAHFERDFIEAQQAAYLETALEDGQLCERMERGRRALYAQGLDDAGPYQSPMEDAMVHFHEWLRRELGEPA